VRVKEDAVACGTVDKGEVQTLLLPGGPNALLRRAVVGEPQSNSARTNSFSNRQSLRLAMLAQGRLFSG